MSFTHSYIFSQSTTLFPYRDKDIYGYCDSNGRVLIKPAFGYAKPFTNGYGIVLFSSTKEKSANPKYDKSIFLDVKGQLAIKDTFDYANEFINELVEIQPGIFKETSIARVRKGDEEFHIDKNGKKILGKINTSQPRGSSNNDKYVTFPYQLSYENGKRIVIYNGKKVLGPIGDYVSVRDIEKGLFEVTDDDKGEALINTNNKGPIKWYEKLTYVGRTLGNNKTYSYFFVIRDSADKVKLIDEDGKVVLSGDYYNIGVFDKTNNILEVIANKAQDDQSISLRGLYDLNTKTLIEPKYQTILLTKYNNIYEVFLPNGLSYGPDYINSKGVEFFKE